MFGKEIPDLVAKIHQADVRPRSRRGDRARLRFIAKLRSVFQHKIEGWAGIWAISKIWRSGVEISFSKNLKVSAVCVLRTHTHTLNHTYTVSVINLVIQKVAQRHKKLPKLRPK